MKALIILAAALAAWAPIVLIGLWLLMVLR
jgi:hypothetical protein